MKRKKLVQETAANKQGHLSDLQNLAQMLSIRACKTWLTWINSTEKFGTHELAFIKTLSFNILANIQTRKLCLMSFIICFQERSLSPPR